MLKGLQCLQSYQGSQIFVSRVSLVGLVSFVCMKFNVITIFPKIISDYCDETILNRAQKNKLIKINSINLRDFTTDNHKTVDDTPYGGGAGMVMKIEPLFKALQSLGALSKKSGINKVSGVIKKILNFKFEILKHKNKKTILLSPRGRQFDQRLAEEFSKLDEITFVCGRYEGVDQRVTDYLVDEEVSIGPYVLAGGELAALVMIESISRLVPGVLGNEESLREETFGSNFQFPISNFQSNSKIKNQKSNRMSLRGAVAGDEAISGGVEYAQYTKPSDFNGWKVPDILLSGNHKLIQEWRAKKK